MLIEPIGIESQEAFGTARVSVAGQVEVFPAAIASAEAFGEVEVVNKAALEVLPTSIASAEAFGIAVLSVAGQTELFPLGIASAEAFGAATVQQLTLGGVPIKTALVEYLLSDPGLVELIGDRLYPNASPHGLNTLPDVIYRRTDGEAIHHMGGGTGLARASFRFVARSKSGFEAGTIGEKVRRLLDTLYGEIGTTVAVFVQRCRLEDLEDEFIAPVNNDEIGAHETRLDFDLHYLETIPSPLIDAR